MNMGRHLLELAFCLLHLVLADGTTATPRQCGTRMPFDSRIVGGTDASEGSWPWIGSLGFSGTSHSCGATLIHPYWAVTAAHCVGYFDTIALGFVNFLQESEHREVRRVTVHAHPNYNNLTLQNDIALLQLQSPVTFTDYVRPACVGDTSPEVLHYTDCMIAGWGTLQSGGESPDHLQEASVRLFNQSECEFYLSSNFHSDVMICGGYVQGGVDTCQGDSGGPFVCKDQDGFWSLVGVTSWGFGCGDPESPGVYARITSFLDFIESHINEEYLECDEGGLLFDDQLCDNEIHCNETMSDEADCDALIVGDEVELTSPNYPRNYPNNQRKEYLYISEPSSHLSVQWLDFNLEGSFDFLYIGADRDQAMQLTGSGIPEDFITPSNTLWVLFTSDYSINFSGFKMIIRVVEGNGTDNCTTDGDCRGHNEYCDSSGRCLCKEGFEMMFGVCIDVDECGYRDLNDCDREVSECVNTEGGYECNCKYGFENINKTCEETRVPCGTITDGSPRTRIVGGADADRGNWPWIGSLQSYYGGHVCGASLISPQWAVTAAHCVGHFDKIIFGEQKLSEYSSYHQESEVQAFSHPDYELDETSDVALVYLKNPVRYSHHVSPVCLSFSSNEARDFSNCWIAGWGSLSFGGDFPDVLQESPVNVFNSSTCESLLSPLFLPESMICAGYIDGGRDSCQGDSGGPLVCEDDDGSWALVGATSWGFGCAEPRQPGVYARISHFRDFIEGTMNRDYFRCEDGTIISDTNAECDYSLNCPDGSDEVNCAPLRDGRRVVIASSSSSDEGEFYREWIIPAEPGLLFRVSFNLLEIGFDQIVVQGSSPDFAVFTGFDLPRDTAFPGPELRISFYREGSPDSRFSMTVLATSEELQICERGVIFTEEMRCDYVVNCPNEEGGAFDEENCPLLSSDDTVAIQSPSYPSPYPNDAKINWLFTAEEDHHFEINFNEFDLEDNFDFVYIANGGNVGDVSEAVFSLTGSRPGTVIHVNSSMMWMQFYTDGSVTRTGFTAEIRVVRNIQEVPCIHYIEDETEGELIRTSSTGGEDCQAVLVTSKRERFKITFDVNIDCSAGEKFILRTSTNERSYCSEERTIWRTNDNVLIIEYSLADRRREDSGFALKFVSKEDPTPTEGCNRFLSGSRGSLKSPGYPNDYKSNKVCETRILAEPGQRISLTFDFFRMQGSFPKCKKDYLQIKDLISGRTHKWCGNQRDVSALDFVSDSFYIKVKFVSDDDKEFAGYYASFNVLK